MFQRTRTRTRTHAHALLLQISLDLFLLPISLSSSLLHSLLNLPLPLLTLFPRQEKPQRKGQSCDAEESYQQWNSHSRSPPSCGVAGWIKNRGFHSNTSAFDSLMIHLVGSRLCATYHVCLHVLKRIFVSVYFPFLTSIHDFSFCSESIVFLPASFLLLSSLWVTLLELNFSVRILKGPKAALSTALQYSPFFDFRSHWFAYKCQSVAYAFLLMEELWFKHRKDFYRVFMITSESVGHWSTLLFFHTGNEPAMNNIKLLKYNDVSLLRQWNYKTVAFIWTIMPHLKC